MLSHRLNSQRNTLRVHCDRVSIILSPLGGSPIRPRQQAGHLHAPVERSSLFVGYWTPSRQSWQAVLAGIHRSQSWQAVPAGIHRSHSCQAVLGAVPAGSAGERSRIGSPGFTGAAAPDKHSNSKSQSKASHNHLMKPLTPLTPAEGRQREPLIPADTR